MTSKVGGWEQPARPPYYVQTGSMFENPYGVPRDEILRFVADNPPEVVAQVVFGRYVESSGLVFTGELIQMLVDRSLPKVSGNQFLDPVKADEAVSDVVRFGSWGSRFFTGVDVARQTDFTVITTIDTIRMPARVVYWKRVNRMPWDSIYAEIGRARFLFGPNILVDSSGPAGDVVMDSLGARLYCPEHHRVVLLDSPQCMRGGKPLECKPESYLPLSCCDGYAFSASSKRELIDHLRVVLSIGYDSFGDQSDFGWLRMPPIPQVEEEMTFYAWDDKRLMTDCVFSLALAAWSGLESPVGSAEVGSVFGR